VDRNAFQGLGILEILVLSNNEIAFLPSDVFAGLFSLTRLSLASNRLTDLPGGIFSGMTKLQRLDVRFNRLQFLSLEALSNVPYTTKIELEGNTINCSCSFLHILNYTLDNVLCYYPWQRRQEQLSGLNATELCTVFLPTSSYGNTTSTIVVVNVTEAGGDTGTTPTPGHHAGNSTPSQQAETERPPMIYSTDLKYPSDVGTTRVSGTKIATKTQSTTELPESAASTVPSATSILTEHLKTPGNISTTVSAAADETDSIYSVDTGEYYRHILMSLTSVPISETNAVSVVNEVAELVSDPSWLNSTDVDEVTTLLEKALTLSSSQELLDNIVEVTDHLMDLDLLVLQNTHRDSKASSRLVLLLEDYVEHTLFTSGLSNLSINHKNLAVEAVKLRPSTFSGMGVVALDEEDGNWLRRSSRETDQSLNAHGVRASIFIPGDVVDDLNGCDEEVAVLFVVYRNSKLFSSAIQKEWEITNKSGVHRVNSLIVSCRIGNQIVRDLANPVSLIFSHNQMGVDPLCSWWDFDKKPFDYWSQEGCTISKSDKVNRTLCLCNHLTNFALLMDLSSQIDSDSEVPETHENTLSILSYIGCALSTFGLLSTIITMLYFRQLRQKMANKLLINLCLALLLVVVIFAAGISRVGYMPVCQAVAALLHFSLLAALMWMGAEAVHLYLTVVRLKVRSSRRYIGLCMAACWGIPVLVVVACFGISSNDYGGSNSKYCWIHKGVFFAGFLVPALGIIVFNFGIFCMVLRCLKDVRPSRGKLYGTLLMRLRVSFATMVILGLTWSFGALTIGDTRVVFQYLFVIFNSAQGFFIFLVHCLGNPEARRAWRGRKMSHRETEEKTRVERPVGGIQCRTPSGRMTWKPLEESPTAGNSQLLNAEVEVNRGVARI
jgi:hypothetical protein